MIPDALVALVLTRRTDMNTRKTLIMGGVAAALAVAGFGGAYAQRAEGRGPGLMGQGNMGPGMMGPNRTSGSRIRRSPNGRRSRFLAGRTRGKTREIRVAAQPWRGPG